MTSPTQGHPHRQDMAGKGIRGRAGRLQSQNTPRPQFKGRRGM